MAGALEGVSRGIDQGLRIRDFQDRRKEREEDRTLRAEDRKIQAEDRSIRMEDRTLEIERAGKADVRAEKAEGRASKSHEQTTKLNDLKLQEWTSNEPLRQKTMTFQIRKLDRAIFADRIMRLGRGETLPDEELAELKKVVPGFDGIEIVANSKGDRSLDEVVIYQKLYDDNESGTPRRVPVATGIPMRDLIGEFYGTGDRASRTTKDPDPSRYKDARTALQEEAGRRQQVASLREQIKVAELEGDKEALAKLYLALDAATAAMNQAIGESSIYKDQEKGGRSGASMATAEQTEFTSEESPAMGDGEDQGSSDEPPVPGAVLAEDGKWYLKKADGWYSVD
jgi:hypothetical protein